MTGVGDSGVARSKLPRTNAITGPARPERSVCAPGAAVFIERRPDPDGTTASGRSFTVDGFVKLVQPESSHPVIRGTLTLDFGNGNTLDVYYVAPVYTGIAEGNY